MKAITFDGNTPVEQIRNWWERRKYLIDDVRSDIENNCITIWYTPKFKEAA